MSSATPQLKYPNTNRVPVTDTYHGVDVVDNYRWLEDPDSNETAEWVTQQNQATRAFLDTCDYREKIKDKLIKNYNFERYSCPFKRGNKYFYFKNDGLQNQSVLYTQGSLAGDSSVLLDPNTLAADGTAALGSYCFTESGNTLAYAVSHAGSDWATAHVMRTDGTQLQDKVEWLKFTGLSFTHDEAGFFYSRYPAPATLTSKSDTLSRGTETDSVQNHMVYYHRLGTEQSDDVLVFSQPDNPKWTLGSSVSDDGDYLLLTMNHSCDPVNRMYIVPLQNKALPPNFDWQHHAIRLIDNFEAEYDYITNEGTQFFFKTNRNAPRYRVIAIDLNEVSEDKWSEIIPHHHKDVLNYVVPVDNNKFVVCYMRDVKEELSLYSFTGELLQPTFPLPCMGAISGLAARKKDAEFFYSFTSFLYPGTIYNVDLRKQADQQTTVFREIKMSGLDPSQYVTEQVFYTSKDGVTKVPMFIVYSKHLVRDGSNPTWLYGYGGFNISIPPSFSVARCVFINNFNGVFAIANIRGGGEYGEEWHKAGIKLKKQNVFDDFIAAAEYLVEHKYTSPSKLAINGGSNGGLLVCACANQRPELFGCVVGQVGVLDMLRFHKFTIGAHWTSDYGSSDNADEFAALLKYSPIHNVRAVPYPALMLTSADHDDRVVPLHSFKYAAELQHAVGGQPWQKQPTIIRVEVKAGHGAGMPLSKRIEEQADVMAFMVKTLDVKATGDLDS